MAAEQLVLPGFHDPGLVVLSVLISFWGLCRAWSDRATAWRMQSL